MRAASFRRQIYRANSGRDQSEVSRLGDDSGDVGNDSADLGAGDTVDPVLEGGKSESVAEDVGVCV